VGTLHKDLMGWIFPWHDSRATTDDTEKREEDEPRIARINTDKKDR
jgi:hypothetical protein